MKKLMFLFAFLFSISFAYSLGCCFDSLTGSCSLNSEQSTCSSQNGQFFADPTCNSVSSCSYGCCVIGTSSSYDRELTCYQKATSRGSQYSWSPTNDASSCSALVDNGQFGACVIQGRFDKTCKYTTSSNCNNGQFFPNQLCSNPSLNTTCTTTTSTTCFNENVYSLDSCGNPDQLKQTCDYSSGAYCSVNPQGQAFCQNLNCEGGILNGQSWCINEDPNKVGSRFFRKYCLNGELKTEPCADFRQESCSNNKCVVNNWQICAGAGNDTKSCDLNSCKVWSATELASVNESSKTLITEHNLDMCVPKIQPGLQIFPPQEGGIGDAEGIQSGVDVCAQGSYSAKIVFKRSQDDDRYYLLADGKTSPFDDWGGAAIFSMNISDWYNNNHNRFDCTTKNPLRANFSATECGDKNNLGCSAAACVKSGDIVKMPVDPEFLALLDSRCQALGDCDSKTNLIGAGTDTNKAGGGISIKDVEASMAAGIALYTHDIPCRVTKVDGGHRHEITCDFEYTCKLWKAPADNPQACALCGENDLPCSEYRCRSMSAQCQYYEPAGADKGYCVVGNDNTPATISHSLNPSSPVPPYSAVEITITTNEDTSCKFNMGSAGATYDDMQYEFGTDWKTEHQIVLSVPGKRPQTIENPEVNNYDLIKSDGKYQMYVRCLDPAGNQNYNAHLVNFEVMDTPDELPPTIINATPSTGSAILFNTNQKQVSFRLNEPAECKWSFEDKDFNLMENNLSCDTEVSDYNALNGYYCSGILTNVTQNMSLQTRYFLRCKDQPWLEGNEDSYYKRNTNPSSYTYFLRPSSKLEIKEITPKGDLMKGSNIGNLTLTAITQGGSENGRAICSWRFSFNNLTTGYSKFINTNSVTHTNILSNLTEGNYIIEVKCQDTAGNIIEKTEELRMRVDSEAPIISKIYNDKGIIKVLTNEPAACKFFNVVNSLSCLLPFNSNETTSLFGTSNTEHTADWRKGFTYLIKCQDFYNNVNSGCGIQAKAFPTAD